MYLRMTSIDGVFVTIDLTNGEVAQRNAQTVYYDESLDLGSNNVLMTQMEHEDFGPVDFISLNLLTLTATDGTTTPLHYSSLAQSVMITDQIYICGNLQEYVKKNKSKNKK